VLKTRSLQPLSSVCALESAEHLEHGVSTAAFGRDSGGLPGRKRQPRAKALLHVAAQALCSGMDWQQVIAIGIVALTVGLFVWTRWRRGRAGPGCGPGCGCEGSAGTTAPRGSVTYRTRKGERPQIITRFS